MEAETWQSALATVGAFAFLGAFIDFLLGSVGQGDLKKLLATWWLRLSYVRLENFGREEATVALQVLDGLFGSRLFSIKRLRSTAVVTAVLLMIYFVIPLLFSPARVKVHSILDWINLGRLSIAASLFAVSISITRFFTNIALRAFSQSIPKNIFLLIIFLLIQYILFCFWPDLTTFTLDMVATTSRDLRDAGHVDEEHGFMFAWVVGSLIYSLFEPSNLDPRRVF